MGFWDTVKGAWHSVKNFFWGDDETLNDKIENWTLWGPTTGSNFNKTLNQTINNWITVEDNSVDVPSRSILDDPEDLLGVKSWDALVEEEKKKENESAWQAMKRMGSDINTAIDASTKSLEADREYHNTMDVLALWYDKSEWTVLVLDIDDEDRFDAYYRQYERIAGNPNASELDKYNARKDFYNQAKDTFKIVSLKPGYARRYNEDTLNKLALNNVSVWKYNNLSEEEFLSYFDVMAKNENKQRDARNKFWLTTTDKDRTIIDLEADESNKWFSNWNLNSTLDIPELIKSSISTIDWGEWAEALAYYEDAQRRLWNAIYQHAAPVYAKERVALSKAPSERNEWDLYVIKKAEELRKMEKQLGANLANWMRQEIKYGTNNKWEIRDALDSFENWENLNDVLTKWLREISWEGRWLFNFRQSPVDIFEAVSNDALYHYNQSNISDPLRRWWNSIESFFRPVGVTLWEVWQIVNESVGEILTLWTAKYTSYLNNDFSIGKLIETDDWKRKRNLKKYTLEGLEYVPEWVWNLLPDIVLLISTSWWSLPTFARFANKLPKRARWISFINKLEKTSSTVQKWLKWLDRLKDMSQQLIKVDSRRWLIDNAIDRWITQFALWQAIDWQWSAYDTEPYSTASYALSALWWVWLDFLPELSTLKWIIRKPIWSVWSLVDYIESSPEAAMNVARALWRDKPEFTIKELEWYAKTFGDIERAAENVYNTVLKPEERVAATQWTKQMMYNYISQAYWANTTIAKNIRQILSNQSLNPADIIKYVGNIPWTVAFWPYTSSITLKHWTRVWITSTGLNWQYKAVLDTLDWWFDKRLAQWFSSEDIEKISTLPWFKDVLNKKNEYFFKMWDNYYLTDDWLKAFDLEKGNIPIESLGVSIAEAENVREILKERMKNLRWINLEPTTIDALADWGWYNAVVEKVKEVLWC